MTYAQTEAGEVVSNLTCFEHSLDLAGSRNSTWAREITAHILPQGYFIGYTSVCNKGWSHVTQPHIYIQGTRNIYFRNGDTGSNKTVISITKVGLFYKLKL